MYGCCQSTVVKTPARPQTLPWRQVPSYFSHVLLSKQITTAATEGKNKKYKSFLLLSSTLIWQYPEMSSVATQLNPITIGGWNSKERKTSSFTLFMHAVLHSHSYRAHWLSWGGWGSTISSARAAVIPHMLGKVKSSILFVCLFPNLRSLCISSSITRMLCAH